MAIAIVVLSKKAFGQQATSIDLGIFQEDGEQCPILACCEFDCCGKGASWNELSGYCTEDPDSPGFDGSFPPWWQNGCADRVCCEEKCCGKGLVYDTSTALCIQTTSSCGPAPAPVPIPVCMPTTGPCVSSFSSFQSAVDQAGSDSVVSLCGSNTITMPSAVVINDSRVTVCCESDDCVLESTGAGRNLVATGSDLTLSNVLFKGGSSQEGRGGGNVEILANGTHRILNCAFEGGRHESSGGNLFIGTFDSVLVQNSRFADGDAQRGGGLYVEDALEVIVTDSEFVNNKALVSTGGGGMMITSTPSAAGQSVTLYNTTFRKNQASFGAGYLATTMGELPKLSIIESKFEDNEAFEGGAVWVALYDALDTLDLTLCGNAGFGNVAENECDDIFFAAQKLCIAVTEDFDS